MTPEELLQQVNASVEKATANSDKNRKAVDVRVGELEQAFASIPEIAAGMRPTTKAAQVGQLAASLKDEDQVAAFKDKRATTARIALRDYHRPAAAITGTSVPSFPQQVPGIQEPLLETLAIEDLLPHQKMTTASIEWLREKAGGDVRAEVQAAQGDLKKQGNLEFEMMDSKAATAAVFLKFSRQVLDDQAGLSAYAEKRLGYGLDDGVDYLLLNGTGTAGQNEGLLLPANNTALDTTGLATKAPMFDYIRRAKTQIRLGKGAANALLLHPSDAEAMDLTKDSQGRYITGGPVDANGRIWGLAPVETTAVTAGQFVVADFLRAAVFYDRMEAMLILGYADDDLTRNMVTMLMERRFAVAWNRPSLIILGSFGSAGK